ncbi:MAG: response regulator [Candidatus Methylomirabilis oxyfera]|nr:response regulator [Candidatus Methylomirabilis oxyfera]
MTPAGERWAEERDRLYAVFEATSDGIALFDLEGRLLLANLAFRKLFGVIPEGLSRDDPACTLAFLKSRAKDTTEFEREFRRLLLQRDTPERDRVELALPHPRSLLRVRTPVLDERGNLVGHVHTLRDVTKEQEVAQMKSEFVSRASHELRTPLTSIKGSLQLLIEGARNLPPFEQELLSVCLRNTDRLIHLVNDILDLSKMEAGKLKLRLSDQVVAHLIERAVAGITHQVEERGVTIEVYVPPDLPQVRVDRDRVVQVLTNLLDNAIKFSGPGERVRVAARGPQRLEPGTGGVPGVVSPLAPHRSHPGDFLEISVTDQGRGIAPHDIDKLFLSFQKLDGLTASDTPGTGLGLAICKGIVEQHGGRIWASSEGLGHGTTLTFLLPVLGPPRPRIMVADDEPRFVRLLTNILEPEEFSVTSAPDGENTLRMVEQAVPDLLILDLRLPGLDGWGVLKALRARISTRHLPILVVTALGAEDAEKTLALGADEYLSKPISPSVLIDTVHRLIGDVERRRREPTEAFADAGAGPISEADTGRPRILIVEDNRVNLELMVELLSPHGFEVHSCGDGREVMRLAKANHPNLILLDINLPNIDGLTLARMLREDPETQTIAILAISAYSMVGDKERMVEAGCDGFIPKPIDTGTFLATVSTFLDRGRTPGVPRGEAGRRLPES